MQAKADDLCTQLQTSQSALQASQAEVEEQTARAVSAERGAEIASREAEQLRLRLAHLEREMQSPRREVAPRSELRAEVDAVQAQLHQTYPTPTPTPTPTPSPPPRLPLTPTPGRRGPGHRVERRAAHFQRAAPGDATMALSATLVVANR